MDQHGSRYSRHGDNKGHQNPDIQDAVGIQQDKRWQRPAQPPQQRHKKRDFAPLRQGEDMPSEVIEAVKRYGAGQ